MTQSFVIHVHLPVELYNFSVYIRIAPSTFVTQNNAQTKHKTKILGQKKRFNNWETNE